MSRFLKHGALPALAPASIVGLYFTPLTVFGCVTRGLIAVSVALVSSAFAFVALGFAFSAVRRKDPESRWWILTAAMLTLPLALLVGPLG
jgi:RsiW-degrading membrane proteinase PrsW (M82 family)